MRATALVLLMLLLAACGSAQSRHASHMARGKAYLAQGELGKANVEFRNALRIDPKDAEALYLVGDLAERRGNLREAIGFYQSAIDTDPDSARARAQLGRMLVLGASPQRALEVVEPGLLRHPDDPDLLAARAAARLELKDDAGALADASRAVQLAPLNEGAVSLLAGLYWQTGEGQRAVELLTETLARLQGSVDLRQALAKLYTARGESQLAEEQLLRIVQTRPRDLATRYQLVSFYIKDKRLDDAEAALRASMVALPDSEAAKFAYTDFLSTYRSPAQGQQAMRELISREPHNYSLQLGLGALQQRVGATEEAIATYRAIVNQDAGGPGGAAARDRIAAIEASRGDSDEALALIGEVLKVNPRDSDALTIRGNLRLQQGDALGAIADLRAVLRDQPTLIPVMRALARAHLANRDPALAEENLRAALKVSTDDVAVRVDLAELLWRTGRAAEAVTLLEDAVKAAGSAAGTPARAALVRAYLVKQDLPAARAAAEDLKRLQPELSVGPYLAGLVAEQQKRTADAQREYEQALRLQPYEPDALAALTRLLLERGESARAQTLVQGAVDHAPGDATMHNLLGEVYLVQQRYREAASACEEAVRLAPTWWVPYRNLAQAKSGAQDPGGALAVYRAGVTATAEPALVTELALLYERQGRIEDAIHEYELLNQRRPHLELAANNLAMLLVTYRKDPTSLDRARDLTASFAHSDVPALLDTRGWVMFKRGEVLQALVVLDRASAGAPDSKVIRYHLGMAELQAGQPDRARADLESALSGAASFPGSEEARQTLASLGGGSAG